MIDFGLFQARDGSPIYMQMVLFVKRGIASGAVRDGDELPSRRVVSALLGVNPNTVQKAYRILEDEGFIESRSGAKSHVALTPQKVDMVRSQLLESEIRAVAVSLRQSGLTLERAVELLGKYWDEEAEK